MNVLVLNSAYMPIDRIPWQDAMTSVVNGRAEVVDVYDATVRSAHEEHQVPSIIRFLTRAVWKRTRVRFNRHNVWLRDQGRCQYCGKQMSKSEYTYDHVIPQSRGGLTRWENIVACCLPCNHQKANRTPGEAGMTLIRPPEVPTCLVGQMTPIFEKMNDDERRHWKDYVKSYSYWHAKLDP